MPTVIIEAPAAAALHAASFFPGRFQDVDIIPNGDGKWTARLSEECLDFIFGEYGDETLSDAIVKCCILDIDENQGGEARFQVCEKLRELYPVIEPRNWNDYLVQELPFDDRPVLPIIQRDVQGGGNSCGAAKRPASDNGD